jgi:hypothetical protein
MEVRYLPRYLAGLAAVVCSLRAGGQPRPVSRVQQKANAFCLLKSSAARLGVREATGRNDGPQVEAAQRAAGAKKGDPWCGCEQYVEQKLCGLPTPAWAAAAANWTLTGNSRTYYIRGQRGVADSIQVGDQVTFYYANLGRVGHVGRNVQATRSLRRGRPARGFIVRAGNTGSGGGRDGAGVHDVFYAATDVYAAANWKY